MVITKFQKLVSHLNQYFQLSFWSERKVYHFVTVNAIWIPFLDVWVRKKTNGEFQLTVYRKPTHTNRYLSAESYHHSAQLRAVANSLISKSIRLTDADSKEQKLKEEQAALQQNR